jgi:hypothetical protein
MTNIDKDSKIGVALVERLGLTINKPEGHDLAGPCIACQSSDAFRLHQQLGVAQCSSCGAKWLPFQVAEHVLGDREQAKAMLIDLGVYQPSNGAARKTAASKIPDPVGVIAKQKGVTRDSLLAYGAKPLTPNSIIFLSRVLAGGPTASEEKTPAEPEVSSKMPARPRMSFRECFFIAFFSGIQRNRGNRQTMGCGFKSQWFPISFHAAIERCRFSSRSPGTL